MAAHFGPRFFSQRNVFLKSHFICKKLRNYLVKNGILTLDIQIIIQEKKIVAISHVCLRCCCCCSIPAAT